METNAAALSGGTGQAKGGGVGPAAVAAGVAWRAETIAGAAVVMTISAILRRNHSETEDMVKVNRRGSARSVRPRD